MAFEGFVDSKFQAYVTKCAPHKALHSIACGKLTFDEEFEVHRVGCVPEQQEALYALEAACTDVLPMRNRRGGSYMAAVLASLQGLLEIKDTHRSRTLR